MIKASFSPEPEILVINSVTDTKQWMAEQTPPLHDHLKAHQFKFIRNEKGQCRMFYKEWSTDDLWLPQTGLTLLPSENTIPTDKPLIMRPFYDADILNKVEATLKKISAYLDKAGAALWWISWLEEARNYVEEQEPWPMTGIFVQKISYYYMLSP